MARSTDSFLARTAYPAEVYEALRRKGIAQDLSVLVEDRTPPPSCCESIFAGLILLATGRFLEFEIHTDLADSEGAVVLRDVTEQVSVAPRVRGIGTTDGYLALELLRRLKEGARG
jgi:hypothetical protein